MERKYKMSKVRSQKEFENMINKMIAMTDRDLSDATVKMWEKCKKIAKMKKSITVPETEFALIEFEPYDKKLSTIYKPMDSTHHSLLSLQDMKVAVIKNGLIGLSDLFTKQLQQ